MLQLSVLNDLVHFYSQNMRKWKGKILPKGVSAVNKQPGKYIARIRVNGTSFHLGVFTSIEAAHDAYCEHAKMHFGEFAHFDQS